MDNTVVLIESGQNPTIVELDANPLTLELTIPSESKLVEVITAGPPGPQGPVGPAIFYLEPISLGNISGPFGSNLNFLTAGKYEFTATGNISLANPVTAAKGIQIDLYIKQDTIGSRTLFFDSNYIVPPGSVLSTTPGTVDIVTLIVMSNGNIAVRISNGIVLSPPGTSYVASNFTIPQSTYNVTINVANGISYLNNSYIYIYDNSQSPAITFYGQIISGGGTTSLVVKNLGSPSSAQGNIVNAGSTIALSGKNGVDGANGSAGINAAQEFTVGNGAFNTGAIGSSQSWPVLDTQYFLSGMYVQLIDRQGAGEGVADSVVGYALITNISNSTLYVTNISCPNFSYSTNQSYSMTIKPAGPRGPAGTNGTNGATGATGATGAQGLRGIGWITGGVDPTLSPEQYNPNLYPAPNVGTIYLNTNTGNYFIWTDDIDTGPYWAGPYTNLKGAAGAKGDTGAQGLPGPAGSIVKGYIYGLTLSNYNSTTGLSVSTGQATDSTGSVIMSLNSAITNKILQASGSWTAGSSNNGLDTGASAVSTCYHIFLIAKVDGTTDILFSTSVSSPTLPTGYSYFRRIGSMFSDASKNWVQFTQNYNRFILTAPSHPLTAATTATTAQLVTLGNVPTGISVRPQIIVNGSAVNTLISDPNGPDIAPNSAFNTGPFDINSSALSVRPDVYTNTSAQVRYRSSSAAGTVSMWCFGWDDLRGALG